MPSPLFPNPSRSFVKTIEALKENPNLGLYICFEAKKVVLECRDAVNGELLLKPVRIPEGDRMNYSSDIVDQLAHEMIRTVQKWLIQQRN